MLIHMYPSVWQNIVQVCFKNCTQEYTRQIRKSPQITHNHLLTPLCWHHSGSFHLIGQDNCIRSTSFYCYHLEIALCLGTSGIVVLIWLYADQPGRKHRPNTSLVILAWLFPTEGQLCRWHIHIHGYIHGSGHLEMWPSTALLDVILCHI